MLEILCLNCVRLHARIPCICVLELREIACYDSICFVLESSSTSIMTFNDTILSSVRFPVPLDINITVVLWNMAELSWQPIKRPENIVYEAAFHQEGNPGLIHSTQTTNTSLVLKDLEQDMGYYFTLRSGNGTVFGRRVSRKTFFATPGNISYNISL